MIEIRQCVEADLPSCAALLGQVYAEPPYVENWPEDRATQYLGSFFRMAPEGALVAAADGGEILGAVFGFRYPWHTGSIVFIQELFVSRHCRGRGIAGRLVRQSAEGKDTVAALIVREGTVAAGFYERLGLPRSPHYEIRAGKIRADICDESLPGGVDQCSTR